MYINENPRLYLILILVFIFQIPLTYAEDTLGNSKKEIKVAVINGMVYSGLWSEITKRFEQKYNYKITLIAHGNKSKIIPYMEKGMVDLITMHSSDMTTNLVANGYAINMRPWARNDLVIIGPKSDPAKIRNMTDGAQALYKIALSQSYWMPFTSNGTREMGHMLWKKNKLLPTGSWVLKTDFPKSMDPLSTLAKHNAYSITGRMPIVLGKWKRSENIEILVDKDPTMKRPYIVLEANPRKFHTVNQIGARLLSDFLLSDEIQRYLLAFDGKVNDGIPLFYPVWNSV